MYINRTNIKGIVAEFLPPETKKAKGVVLFCPGAPAVPSKRDLIEFMSKKGYWCFVLRYAGSWESAGEFLKYSPVRDVQTVVNGLKSFRGIWSNQTYHISNLPIYVIGSSFGAPAALLNSKDKRVTKVISISGVADWKAKTIESYAESKRVFTQGFAGAYRMPLKNLKKLFAGKFYNPTFEYKNIDGSKCIFVHNTGDKVCPISATKKLAKLVKSPLTIYKIKSHSSPLLNSRNFGKLVALLTK